MNERPSTISEGNPAVEQVERQVLGNENYQKVEVVHRFADTHPWFYPFLGVGILAIMACVILLLRNYFKKRP